MRVPCVQVAGVAGLLGLLSGCAPVAREAPREAGPPPVPAEPAKAASMLPGGAAAWEPVWADEFDYPDADLTNAWVSQNGPSGHILSSRWRENAVVSNGTLRLVARKERRGGQEWTAGNIWTRRAFQYGYFECRYRYGAAEGLNNSFWIMPTSKVPPGHKRFEIDINEGHFPSEVNNNIHNHTDTTNLNGRTTHPSSSRSFVFGVRPDVTVQLEIPVTTRRIRFSSRHAGHVHLGEFRAFGASAAGYPDALSPTADKDKPGLVNFVREPGARITASGFLKEDSSAGLADGRIDTRWTSQKDGDKWVEIDLAGERTIGCVQFLNGWGKPGDWKGLIEDYRVAWHDGATWIDMAAFDLREGSATFAREFHTFGLDWTEKELVFYLDGKELRRERNAFCHSPAPVWLSLAVIAWAGRVTDAADGAAMEVDHVRVYRRRP